jgi:hypothetical protein
MSTLEPALNTQEQKLRHNLCKSIQAAILEFESQTPYKVEEIDVDLTRKGDINGIRGKALQPTK